MLFSPLTAYQVSATKSSDSQVKTSGKAINMWWAAPWSGYPDVMVLLVTDVLLGVFSLILIFTIILLNTTSLLLTLAGLFEILASIPLAMFLWMLCGQVHSQHEVGSSTSKSTYSPYHLLTSGWDVYTHRGP